MGMQPFFFFWLKCINLLGLFQNQRCKIVPARGRQLLFFLLFAGRRANLPSCGEFFPPPFVKVGMLGLPSLANSSDNFARLI